MSTSQLHSITFKDLANRPMLPREYLLNPWLREHESALVWAASGIGKTMFTLTLALAIAGGGRVLEWSAPRPRKVLVIDGEMPEDDLRDRLMSLAKTVEGIDHEAAGENLRILARHAQPADATFPDFADEKQHDAILERIRRYGVDLVILDNLSTLAGVEDENSAGATRVIVKFLARLKQAKIATIVVHHANKSENSFRGSTMLATTFEVIIGLRRDKGQTVVDTTGNTRFGLRWDKYRGKRASTIRDTTAFLEESEEGLRWIIEATSDDVLQAIAAMVRSGRYSTQQDVIKALPEHFWPNKGSPPSTGWMSKQFNLADAQGILTKAEREKFFSAASECDEDQPNDDQHDDL